MIVTYKTKADTMEANRLHKSQDMAIALFDIIHNMPKEMRYEIDEKGRNWEEVLNEHLAMIAEDNDINIDTLIE